VFLGCLLLILLLSLWSTGSCSDAFFSFFFLVSDRLAYARRPSRIGLARTCFFLARARFSSSFSWLIPASSWLGPTGLCRLLLGSCSAVVFLGSIRLAYPCFFFLDGTHSCSAQEAWAAKNFFFVSLYYFTRIVPAK
jgi:hypothetical protein